MICTNHLKMKKRFHAEHYQYTESKRIFELWKQSDATAKLCMNKKGNGSIRSVV